MCQVATAEFESELSAAAEARAWVADRLSDWHLAYLADTVLLLTSELVSNAVTHASARPSVTVSIADGVFEVGVTDDDKHLPRVMDQPACGRTEMDEDALMAEGGRGLLLVEVMADEWGATRLDRGKHVWFRLGASDWRGRAECRCSDEHADRLLLLSGRYAEKRSPGR